MIPKAIKAQLITWWANISAARRIPNGDHISGDAPIKILPWSCVDYLTSTCIFAIVVVTNINTVLNNAYSFGSTLFDSTTFQTVTWRSGWDLHLAPVLGSMSFLNDHFSPINYLPDALSYLLPIDRMTYFGLAYGVVYGSLVVVVFRAFRQLLGGRTIPAAVGCLLFYFCGPVNSVQWEPHQEIASGLFTLVFFLAWGMRRQRWAILALVLNAAVREDCGILLALPLFLIGIHAYLNQRGKRLNQDLHNTFFLAALSTLLSVISFIVKQILFNQVNEFAYYYGPHLFAHLSSALLMERLQFIFAHDQYLWLPGLVLLVGAVWLRDVRLFFGWVAFLPYWLFNFFSIQDLSAELLSYKSFPFILTMVWPAILALRSPQRMRHALTVVQVLVLLSATITWENGSLRVAAPSGVEALLDRWHLHPETENGQLYRSFESRLEGGDLGLTRASIGALALYPYSFDTWDKSWVSAGPVTNAEKLDSIFWFQGDRDQPTTDKWIQSGHFPFFYRVIGTRLAIATRKQLDKLPPFVGAIEPVPVQ